MKAKDLMRYAESKGWTLHRITGSHHVYKHADQAYLVVIPAHGSKDLAPGTLAILMKQIDGRWKGPHA
jgi:predicted RNA binding protein YcfA (HicA-like mRNA interferase family)